MTPDVEELVATAAELGRTCFAPRAARYDRDARFPTENYSDLADAGLLGLCIPVRYGGLGAGFATYCRVAAEIGRHCGATALTFNMHSVSCLWSSVVVDDLDLSPQDRAAHEERRAALYERVLGGDVLAQPFSEPDGDAGSGRAPFATTARATDGGFVVSGRKHFASLAGHADHYAVTCTEQVDGPEGSRTSTPVTRFLVVPAQSAGLSVTGTWDPLGMRGTVSRTLELDDVFVPGDRQLMPADAYRQAARRWPYMFFTLTPTYLGIARAALDFAVAYLRGEMQGGPGAPRRSSTTKQLAVARLRVLWDQADTLWQRVIEEAGVDPTQEQRLRMFSAQWTVMEHANEIARRAIEVCGGRSIMRSLALERLYRDSRCGALMLPYTAEICLERLGHESLYRPGERD